MMGRRWSERILLWRTKEKKYGIFGMFAMLNYLPYPASF
jgi:hypothetical protein